MINSRHCLSVTCGCYFYTELTNSNQTLSTLCVYSSGSDCHHLILVSPQAPAADSTSGSAVYLDYFPSWLSWAVGHAGLRLWDPISFGIELIARKWAVAGSDGGIRRASARIDETRDQGWNIHYSRVRGPVIRSDRAGVDTSRLRSGLLFLCSSHKCRVPAIHPEHSQSKVSWFLVHLHNWSLSDESSSAARIDE